MENYKDVASLSENIMIRELQKQLGYVGEKSAGEQQESEEPGNKCVFCGRKEKLLKYMGKYYCYQCYLELQEIE